MRKVVTDYALRITSVADSLDVGLAILPQPTIISIFKAERSFGENAPIAGKLTGMKLLKILGASLFGVGLALVLLEVFFRLFVPVRPVEPPGWFWKAPDPITGWSAEPGAEGRSYNEVYEYDVEVKINDLGLRSPENIGYEKSEGVYRILVLGDSFTEAIQVALEETFGQQLARILNEEGCRVEVINAGVGGWGNDQELLWLKNEGYKYHPDLIILQIFPRNDFMNNYQPLEAANMGANLKPYFRMVDGELELELFPYDPEKAPPVQGKNVVVEAERHPPGPLTPVGEWLFRHSYFWRWFDPRIRLIAPDFAAWLARTGLIKPGRETRNQAQGANYLPITFNAYRMDYDEDWQRASEVTAAIFAEMKREANAMGADLVAVLANASEEVYPRAWKRLQARYPALQSPEFSPDSAHEHMLAVLAAEGIPTLDLRDAFRQASAEQRRMLHYRVDGHWTPAGHALAARELARFLQEQGLLCSP